VLYQKYFGKYISAFWSAKYRKGRKLKIIRFLQIIYLIISESVQFKNYYVEKRKQKKRTINNESYTE